MASMIAILTLATLSVAAPIPKLILHHPRDGFTSIIGALSSNGLNPVSVSQADQDTLGLKTAASLASAAYCPSVGAGNWTCPDCANVPDVQLLFQAGDGGDIPRVYVGYSPALSAVIVSHEGSEANIESWVGNLDANLVALDSSISSSNSSIQVHEGFQSDFLQTKDDVLKAVNSALAGPASTASRVLVTGHSKGAAISTFEALHLRQQLPSSMDLQLVTFGQPRIGNPDFSDFVGSVLGESMLHVTNNNDIVPRVPGTFLGYEQVNNEFWVDPSSNLQYCPGVENPSCSAGISDIDLSADPHRGPYFGIMLTVHAC